MKKILIVGPDSTLRDTYTLASQVYTDRHIEMLFIPSSDYYNFDLSGLENFDPSLWNICIAVNEFYINDVRRALHEKVSNLGYEAISLISPNSHLDSSVTIGENTIIHAGCFIGAGSTLGNHCTLRPNVVLGEDVKIGNYVTLEANVSVRELCKIGNFSTICSNSSLARSTEIGAHCYLNLSQQYMGIIPSCTFYSPIFENPIQVFATLKIENHKNTKLF